MIATHAESIRDVTGLAWWIGLAHIVAGLCILIEPQAMLVSAFAGLRWVTALYVQGGIVAGVGLMAIGGAAVAGGTHVVRLQPSWRLSLIGPQVILLVFTVASVALTIAEGRYPDGYVPAGGPVFIIADQALAAFVSLFHIISVLSLPIRRVE